MACEDIQTKLTAAEAAYDRLMLGRSPRVFVDSNGERVEYTAVSATRLYAYVAELRTQLATCLGTTATPILRPLAFRF